jgi:hypothetical protein
MVEHAAWVGQYADLHMRMNLEITPYTQSNISKRCVIMSASSMVE